MRTEETVFTVPDHWRRYIHPRRGDGSPAPTIKGDPVAAARTLIEASHNLITAMLGDRGSDRDLVAAARDQLAAMSVTPLGAAATLAVVAGAAGRGPEARMDEAEGTVLVDALVRTRGIVFAAQVMGELAGIEVVGTVLRHAERAGVGYPHMAWLPALRRTRAHLATAAATVHREATAALCEFRARGGRQRTVTSYLMPDRADWVSADCREAAALPASTADPLLLYAVATTGQLRQVLTRFRGTWLLRPDAFYTLAAALGPDASEHLIQWAQGYGLEEKIFDILAHLPTDEAFGMLLERLDRKEAHAAVLKAAARYPERAARLLSAVARRDVAALGGRRVTPLAARLAGDLLLTHVTAHAPVVTELLPSLPDEVRDHVRGAIGATHTVPPAPTSLLPQVLVAPPWAVRKPRRAVVVDPLALPPVRLDPDLEWADGERAAWAQTRGERIVPLRRTTWEDWARTQLAMDRSRGTAQLLAQGPEHMARPQLATWRPEDGSAIAGWLRAIVARFGVDAFPVAMHAARLHPATHGYVLLPFVGTEVAELMADWFARLRSARDTARAWLRRHPLAAATALIPAAVGNSGKARDTATEALRVVVAAGHAELVRRAAEAFGPAAVDAIEPSLHLDPLDLLPTKMPRLPEWAPAVAMPPVLLGGRAHALPPESVTHLCAMLSISTMDEPYAGLDTVREVCDPASLAALVWALFVRWRAALFPPTQGWVLDAVGMFGDDEAVAGLVPAMRSWPGNGGFARAMKAVRALAAIGTDLALRSLHTLPDRTTSPGLAERARELLAEAAAGRGLTADELGDRLVPDLGVDSDGTICIDYGRRSFVVAFGEHLQPRVYDGDGRSLRSLPKPGVKDEATRAGPAYRRYWDLAKQAQVLAGDELRRLERAMVWRRRWSAADLRTVLLAHPLLRNPVRSLVWGVYDGDGNLVTALRIAEDLTLADLDDRTVALDPGARVGIVHPAELGDELPRWIGLLADYEVLQPLEQVGRDVHRLHDDERAATRLARLEGLVVPTKKVVALTARGWVHGEREDRVQLWVHRPVPGGRTVVARLDPGISFQNEKQQRLDAIWVNDNRDPDWEPSGAVRFGEVDVASLSEVMRDLTDLKG